MGPALNKEKIPVAVRLANSRAVVKLFKVLEEVDRRGWH